MSIPEIIIDNPESFAACLAELDRSDFIGLDTEFIGENTYTPELCLIQIATPHLLMLIDPLQAGSVEALWDRLQDPGKTVVVHAGREELRMCHTAVGQLPPNVVDLQIAAGFLGKTYPIGYAALIQNILGKRLAKEETLTDWKRRPLSASQIRYAFDDVRHLLPIWKRFQTQLSDLHRLSWLEEEMTTFKKNATTQNPKIEKWRKLKGAGTLRSSQLAVLRAVFEWREQRASKINRPPRTLLRDDLCVELARRDNPKERDILSIRGISKGFVPEILDCITEAKRLHPEEWPEETERDSDPAQVAIVSTLLGAVLTDWCLRHRLTSNFVATASDFRKLIRAKIGGASIPGDCQLANGWRASHVLPQLLPLLDGKASIRIDNLREETPLRWEED